MRWTMDEERLGRDEHVMERIPKANKATAVHVADVDPENYDKIKLEKEGLEYFKEMIAPYELWAEVKYVFNLKDIKKALGLTEKDLREVFQKEVRDTDRNQIEMKKDWEHSKLSKEGKIEEELRTAYIMCLSGKERDWAGASELLVNYIQERNHIYSTKSDLKPEIWVYKEGIYVPNGKSEIKQTIRRILKEYFSEYIANMVISKIQADTQIEADEFFKKSYLHLVPTKNGILNIFTKELKPFDPALIFFNKIPISYEPEAKCPNIDKFFKGVLSLEDDVNVLYELMGFSLLNEYRFEKAFMLVGGGRNGKGKTIELMKRFIGVENCASLPLSQLLPESFSISELFRKRFNLAGDIGHQDLKDVSTFKGLTGRDLVGGKRKFLENIYFENYAKMVFACNDLPMVYDTSRGFWDRWILLEFPYTFVPQKEYDDAPDPEKSKLKVRQEDIIESIVSPEEMSGLLNMALVGLKRLIEHKGFSVTSGTKEIKNLWIRKANSFIAFASDCLEDSYDSVISKRELRKRYSEYCKKHSIPLKSDYVIKRVLNEEFGASDDYGKTSTDPFSKQEYIWKGIKWKA